MFKPEIELRKRRLDFTSSGQGLYEATEVVCDGKRLINAVELLDYSDGAVQVIVCEQCGHTGCQSGAWATVRRLDDNYVFLPAMEFIRGGEWESAEYLPPGYMASRGPFVLDRAGYVALVEVNDSLPDPDLAKQLSTKDVLGVIQLEAPAQALGTIDCPAVLKSDDIVAVTEGDLDLEIKRFRKLVERIESLKHIEPYAVPKRVVEFHLDTPKYAAWRPFGYGEDGMTLLNLEAVS